MNIRSLSTKILPLTLLFILSITVVAQAPIFPFPAQPPAPPQNQVKKPLQRPFLVPVPVTNVVGSENSPESSQRPYLAPVPNIPTTVIAPSRRLKLIVVSEHEFLNMDLRTELAYQNRLGRQVQTNRDINSFIAMVLQNFSTDGWSTSWQGTRASTYLTDFYHSGGQHLRIEIESASTGGYNVLLYKF